MNTKQIQLIKKSSSHWEIVFNRPEKYNAVTSEMYERVTQIINDASKDEELVLITITGTGKFYSAGTDLMEAANTYTLLPTDEIQAIREKSNIRIKSYIECFINCPKIIIAFLNGPAVGVSVTTLGLFDGVYASSSSTFQLPLVRIGLTLEGCSSYTFPALMGSLHAKEILLFDRKLTAVEAQQRGLVTRIIDENVFEQEKNKICQEILSLPKGSLLASKGLIQKWNIDMLNKVNQEETNLLKQRAGNQDFAEAFKTFLARKNRSKL